MGSEHPVSGAIYTYTIPASIVDFCRLGGRRSITRLHLRSLTHDDVTRALACSSGNEERAELALLIYILHAIQIEDEPTTILDPGSDTPELHPYQVFRTLPARIIALMRSALMEQLLPAIHQAA